MYVCLFLEKGKMNLSDVNMFDLIQRNTGNWLRKLIGLIKLENYPDFISFKNYSIYILLQKTKLVIKKIFWYSLVSQSLENKESDLIYCKKSA